MTVLGRRHRWRLAAAALGCAAALPALTGSATGDNLTKLHSKLGSARSQLSGNQHREQAISSRIAGIDGQVRSLQSQIALVQSREAAANAQLATYQANLVDVRRAMRVERAHLRHLEDILARARHALVNELVSQYEQPQQSLVDVIVNASGFQQLLDSLQYLSSVRRQQQTLIEVTRIARSKAQVAEARLVAYERRELQAANDTRVQSAGLAGMNALLSSRQAALQDARAAQTTALAAAQAQGSQLQSAIVTIKQRLRAARQVEKKIAPRPVVTYTPPSASTSGSGTGKTGTTAPVGTTSPISTTSPTSGVSTNGGVGATGGAGTTSSSSSGSGNYAYGGWAIPYAIVLCESGGQNLPPNSAGASGYYQIMPATWRGEGGTGPAAYLASKAEQSAVAARLWNNGAGASNWTCAAMVGIS